MCTANMTVETHSAEETRAIGASVAAAAKPGEVYGLCGDLGAGKTEFVRGFVRRLNPAARVQSPSFSLLKIYCTPVFPIYHFDFYRLTDAHELGELGFEEYAAGNGVCIIEWASMFAGVLPPTVRLISFTQGSGDSRIIRFGEWAKAGA